MAIAGVIAEYNPFHRGHAWQLRTIRNQLNAAAVVVVMSGSFTQRGGPAVTDKWSRAKAALENGADLVLELPVPYAVASAQYFAAAGVALLSACGIVTHLCFGTESPSLAPLQQALAATEAPDFPLRLRRHLRTGLSYAAATAQAWEEQGLATGEDGARLTAPNNLLGLEYLRALRAQNSALIPVAIPRPDNDADPTALTGLPSATAIRHAIAAAPSPLPLSPEVAAALPDKTLAEAFAQGRGPVFAPDFSAPLFYRLRTLSPAQLKKAGGFPEGLENRVLATLPACSDWEELCAALTSRRYPRATIRRCLCRVLLDCGAPLGAPAYLRVLGFRKDAASLLGDLAREAALPVLTNPGRQWPGLSPAAQALFAREVRATDIYGMACQSPALRKRGLDFTQPLVQL